MGSGCHGQAVAKHSSFTMVTHWFPRLADLRRNTHDKVLTSQTGLAMVSCFSVQGLHTTGIIQQEVTVYFDCVHGMAIQTFVAARCTKLRILFPVYSHMFTSLQAEKNGCQSSKEYQRTTSPLSSLEY